MGGIFGVGILLRGLRIWRGGGGLGRDGGVRWLSRVGGGGAGTALLRC